MYRVDGTFVAAEFSGIRKSFPAAFGYVSWVKNLGRSVRRAALHDVSFAVKRGELFGLLGANGAGKSTILRLLAGLVLPDSGRITIDGVDARAEPLRARRRIGFCSGEERSFYYRLTARSNLMYFGALAGMHRGDLPHRIEEVARAVDLFEELDARFDRFSAGMRQRLSFARALLADPSVLLLDEPTRAVDPGHAYELRRFIREDLVGRYGKTVILATNQLDEAWELCDRIAVLRAGRIVTVASPAELGRMASPVRRYSIGLDRIDEVLLARLRAMSGVISFSSEQGPAGVCLSVDLDDDARTLTHLMRIVSANGVSITSVGPGTVRPADVFARLTGASPDDR
jgi:ABC-2 type transport system ATP-binding protein